MSAEEGPLGVAAPQEANQTPSWTGGEENDAANPVGVNCGPVLDVEGTDGSGRMRPQGAPVAPAGLPCLNSNNSTERKVVALSSHARKTAFALVANLELMVDRHGLERIVFGTLGFADPEPDDIRPNPNENFREAGRRLNSLRSHVLNELFPEMIIVPERGAKSGRLHYHIVAAQEHDVRTGVDFAAIAAGDYRSAPNALRQLWRLFRDKRTGGDGTAEAYGFGRTEWLPVKSSAEGIAKYVGKYIAKQFDGRRPEDKGMRLVRYTQGTNYYRARFSWNSPRAKLWRWQVAKFAAKHGCANLDDLSERFGPRWAFKLRERIAWQEEMPTSQVLREVWLLDRLTVVAAVARECGSSIQEAFAALIPHHSLKFDMAGCGVNPQNPRC